MTIYSRACSLFTYFAADLRVTAKISQSFCHRCSFELFITFFPMDKLAKTASRDLDDFQTFAKQTSYINVRMSQRIKQSSIADIWNSTEQVKHTVVYKVDRSGHDVRFGRYRYFYNTQKRKMLIMGHGI